MEKTKRIELICQSNDRIPYEFRKDGDSVKDFVETIKNNKFEVKNKYVNSLIKMYETKNDTFSVVEKISYVGIKETVDLEVENSHSYVANGIVAHMWLYA